jgi:positive regulator of sigma E activity
MTEEERILRRIPVEIVILSFVLAIASIFFFNPLTGLFVFAGGAFSALSFIWLRQTVSRFLLLKNGHSPSKNEKKGGRRLKLKNGHSPSKIKKGDKNLKEKVPAPFFKGQPQLFPDKKKVLRSALTLYVFRLVLILAIFFIIIFFFSNKVIAFVAGFTTIVPVFLAESVVALTRVKKWKS